MTSIHRTRGAALGSNRPRLFAVLALGAAVAFGTTGCSLVATQATTIPYSAAEGVNIHGSGPLEVRNAFIVATADGTNGNFVAAIINQTDRSETLNLEFGEGSSAIQKSVVVPANSVVSLGAGGTAPLLLQGIDTMPGADIAGYFQSGDAEGVLKAVPVLDGQLKYLAPLVP
ncbi:DNA modification methylase [Microbacterium deminutum]|uniref:DNA modification methylase n=1 Tax=Microbacterium deminutum TaxID=344164 RepID=A0ABN2RAX3_9MICO